MDGPRTRLKRLTDDCTVKILPGEIVGGTGFFVAPGLVISCAHVMDRGDGTTAATATIEWQGKQLPGTVRAMPMQRRNTGIWPFPDLCVVEISDPPDHKSVTLGELRDSDCQDVYLGGYNNIYDAKAARFQAKSARLGEPTDLDGGRMWQLSGCEIAPGMSGGPVLDLSSGVVIAVAKMRRMADTDMGGLVIPASVIQAEFPDIWAKNRQLSAGNTDWGAQRAALLEMSDRLGSSLTPRERETLVEAATALRLQRADFNALWREIVGDLAPVPRPFNSVLDLAAELADITREDLDPLIKLFKHLAFRRQLGTVDALNGCGASLAQRSNQAEEFSRYAIRADTQPEQTGPIMLVRLERYGPNPMKKFLVKIWRYATAGAPAKQVSCDRGPHTEREVKKIVTAVLAQEIPDLPAGQLMIEFALPDHLLDRAVEAWAVDGWSLGVDYPVVIRFAERPRLELRTWQLRGQQLRSRQLPAMGSPEWADVWVDCQDHRSIEQLNGAFQRDGTLPFVALAAWRQGTSIPSAVIAARHAGAPVMLWKHSACTDHEPAAGSGEAGRPCEGHRFQDMLAEYLAGMELHQLPEAIRQLRANAASRSDDSEYLGHQVAILWDDPSRFPWADAPPAARPSEG